MSWQMRIKKCYGWSWAQTPVQKHCVSSHDRNTEGGSLWLSTILHIDHWGHKHGPNHKTASRSGFIVNLHHSSVFLPAALNINMDSWGGQGQSSLGLTCDLCQRNTSKAFNWGSLLALGLYRGTVTRTTLFKHGATAGIGTCINVILLRNNMTLLSNLILWRYSIS